MARSFDRLARHPLPRTAEPPAGLHLVELIDMQAGAPNPALPTQETEARLPATVVQGRHLRAARGLVGWPLHELAEASQLSVSTLRRLEDDVAAVSRKSRFRAIAALYAAGARFILINGMVVAVTAAGDLPGV